MSGGRRAFPPWTIVSRSRTPASAKSTTCSRACTPASVRPAARTRTGSCRICASTFSTVAWMVGPFGWTCHPAYAVPSYATVSLTRRTGCVMSGEKNRERRKIPRSRRPLVRSGPRVPRGGQTAAGCRYFCARTSAICTALRAAPLRSWSPHTHRFRQFSALSSSRIRPT